MLLIKQVSVFIFSFLLLISSSAFAAIQALATRVIYNGTDAAATLNLKNNASQPYMIQTWLESNHKNDQQSKLPMVVVPPLMRIDPGKESVLRFIYSGQGLPLNQESLFWINIQEIPPKPEQENTLQLAIHSKMKLFFRPKQVKERLEDAVKTAVWFKDGTQLKLKNTSALYITIGVVKLNGSDKAISELTTDMVPPGETITVLNTMPMNTQRLSFTYINDYGGATEVSSVTVK